MPVVPVTNSMSGWRKILRRTRGGKEEGDGLRRRREGHKVMLNKKKDQNAKEKKEKG